jgi:hypothetical protein
VCTACGRQARSSHLSRTFKLSKDKQFEAKFCDVIGLYLDPPEKALVLAACRFPMREPVLAPLSRDSFVMQLSAKLRFVCRWGPPSRSAC